MTTQPFTVEASATLKDAEDLMAKHQIRHLPVVKGQKVVGIVSDRDIKLACGIEGVDSAKLLVIDISSEKPYIVEPDAPLSQVADTMASKHYGSAIVMQNQKLVGIFTTVDACRALTQVIETRFHAK